MKITAKQLKALDPCKEGYQWFIKHKSRDLKEVLLSVNAINPSWARWLYTNLMSVKQRRILAIYAAEQVLPIFEKSYPDDNRPRKAIKAVKAVLVLDNADTRRAASNAAARAYNAYANVAAAYAAHTACTAYTGYANDAADAAENAVDAVDAGFAQLEMQKCLIIKAMRILENE